MYLIQDVIKFKFKISTTFMYREGNRVAHNLARFDAGCQDMCT